MRNFRSFDAMYECTTPVWFFTDSTFY